MTEKNILKDAFQDRNNQYVSIKKVGNKKRRIIARFEESDNNGILLILKKDETKVINSCKETERKTFIPWHQIVDMKFL